MAAGKQYPGYRFLGLGMELAAAVVGLTLVGYWIDRHFDTHPWGLLIGSVAGVLGGLYNMVKAVLVEAQKSGDDADLTETSDRKGSDPNAP